MSVRLATNNNSSEKKFTKKTCVFNSTNFTTLCVKRIDCDVWLRPSMENDFVDWQHSHTLSRPNADTHARIHGRAPARACVCECLRTQTFVRRCAVRVSPCACVWREITFFLRLGRAVQLAFRCIVSRLFGVFAFAFVCVAALIQRCIWAAIYWPTACSKLRRQLFHFRAHLALARPKHSESSASEMMTLIFVLIANLGIRR